MGELRKGVDPHGEMSETPKEKVMGPIGRKSGQLIEGEEFPSSS